MDIDKIEKLEKDRIMSVYGTKKIPVDHIFEIFKDKNVIFFPTKNKKISVKNYKYKYRICLEEFLKINRL